MAITGTISTHSLTRRLTAFCRIRITVRRSFQLTASRGGWRRKLHYRGEVRMVFQLTASRGGWRHSVRYHRPDSGISTHSLTRRLTSVGQIGLDLVVFQLTASRGGWQHTVLVIPNNSDFNSQPHEEADRRSNQGAGRVCISTHSLTRRLTFPNSETELIEFLFQLTASRGGWRFSVICDWYAIVFQLTASRGGWQQF